jgi:L-aspartate oxidase
MATTPGGDDAEPEVLPPPEPSRRTWEATNILTVATAVVAAANARTESRGCHRRADHPDPVPEWQRHLDVRLDVVGVHVTETERLGTPGRTVE